MRGASTREERVGVGADLFEHLDVDFDRAPGCRLERCVREALGADAEHDVASFPQEAGGVASRRTRILPERDVIVRRSQHQRGSSQASR